MSIRDIKGYAHMGKEDDKTVYICVEVADEIFDAVDSTPHADDQLKVILTGNVALFIDRRRKGAPRCQEASA